MPATSFLRGSPIYFDDTQWFYLDSRFPTALTWAGRPCGFCGEYATTDGHDHCLGELPDIANACCGHGNDSEAYMQSRAFNALTVRGSAVAIVKRQPGG